MEVKSLTFSSSSIKLPASQDVSKVMNSKTPVSIQRARFTCKNLDPRKRNAAEVGDFEEEIDCRGSLTRGSRRANPPNVTD